MCETTVYINDDGENHKVMEDVVLIQPEDDAYLLVNILGEQKLVQGRIVKMDFLKHTVHLSRPQESSAVES